MRDRPTGTTSCGAEYDVGVAAWAVAVEASVVVQCALDMPGYI